MADSPKHQWLGDMDVAARIGGRLRELCGLGYMSSVVRSPTVEGSEGHFFLIRQDHDEQTTNITLDTAGL